MSYYCQQPLKRHSLASNNSNNSSFSTETQSQQQQFVSREEPSNTPNNFATMTYKPYLLREDGEHKIPLFLIKLWNIVEDPSHWEVIRWDETGLSFHIMKPYDFCSDILPYYFKHKNLNSLVRQLNMYGFRKNTPIERSGLARAESDQDHLEFFHPFFRRDHPELLTNIHRKVPNSAKQQGHHRQPPAPPPQHLQVVANVADVIGGTTAMDVGREETVTMRTKDLTNICDELRTMRDRQKNMEMRMDELTKENEMLWNEMAHIRGTHLKQQQIVNKLIQFLVALVGPAAAAGKQSHRLGKKRPMYVLEEFREKRLRECVGSGAVPYHSSASLAGGSGCGGGTGGAGTINAPPIYSTTVRFPPAPCSAASTASAVPTATSIIPDSASASSAEFSASTRGNHASQLQSMLPANATEILDRLINEIASNRNGTGRLTDGGVPNSLDTYDLRGVQIDDLSSPSSANSSNNDQQIQSYVAVDNNNYGSALSTMRQNRTNSSSNSGPIIAEVTEEFDGLNSADGGSRVPFQTGVPPPPPQQQIQRRSPNYQNYINEVVGQRKQQTTKYDKLEANGDGTCQQRQGGQQQLVVYQPMQEHLIHQPISEQRQRPEQQMQQQQQLAVLPCQPTTTAIAGQHNNMAAAQPAGSKRQHLQQNNTGFTAQIQQLQNSSVSQPPPVAGFVGQQTTNPNELQNILSTPPNAHQEPTPSLSDGMLLSDTEMADIAGLNAFLDDNSARFNSLTNSIGEHWVNGVDDDDLRLQDLFHSVEELSNDQEQNIANAKLSNDRLPHVSVDQQQPFFNNDDHLDFSFDLQNDNETTA